MAVTQDSGTKKSKVLPVNTGVSGDNTVHQNISLQDKYGVEIINKAEEWGEKAGQLMTDLAAVCKEYKIENVKKTFGFTFSEGQYLLFIDYETLLSELKKDSNTIII